MYVSKESLEIWNLSLFLGHRIEDWGYDPMEFSYPLPLTLLENLSKILLCGFEKRYNGMNIDKGEGIRIVLDLTTNS